jgi:indole-3-glycerol phosphate synthase
MTSSFLSKMTELVRDRVTQQKRFVSEVQLRSQIDRCAPALDVLAPLRRADPVAVIAEVKRSSPSRGAIAMTLNPIDVAQGYARAGAVAISVLTEPHYFGGSIETLREIRLSVRETPLLLKDFVLDEYQILQARAFGADAVLLIVAFLDLERLKSLYHLAIEMGLTPLVEVHNETEFAVALSLGARWIGVNNRDLNDLKVDLAVSFRMAPLATQSGRQGALVISESGIESAQQIRELKSNGYSGFLIGTRLMSGLDPEAALRGLLTEAAKT